MAALRLQLDNVTSLPDGGPTSFEVSGGRSVEIGRNTYLDWTLPDEHRLVSGTHCEIHYRDGSYWVVDVSTNGTFLNGSDKRLTEPWRLRTGDRLGIGDYLVSVLVEDERSEPARPEPASPGAARTAQPAGASLWDVPDADAAVPEAPARRIRASRPVRADMLDWVADLPTVDRAKAEPAVLDPSAIAPDNSPRFETPDRTGAAEMPPTETWQAASSSGDPTERFDATLPHVQTLAEKQLTEQHLWSIATEDDATASQLLSRSEDATPAAIPTQPASPIPLQTATAPGSAWLDNAHPADLSDAIQPASPLDISQVATEAVLRRPGQDAPFSGDPALVNREGRASGALGASLTLQAGPDLRPATGSAPGASGEPTPSAAALRAASSQSGGSTMMTAQESSDADDRALQRLLTALAAELGIPAHRIAGQTPEELGQRLGRFMRLTVSGLHELLRARASSRGYLRAGAGTMVQAVGNNPLKFMPTTEAAIDLLLGPPSASYLDIDATLSESFHDLGAHQVALYSAMQKAVQRLLSDLEPAAIEAEGEGRAGFINTAATRKAKHWDTYKERYQARADAHDNGMIDVFMLCFSDAYDRAMKGDD